MAEAAALNGAAITLGQGIAARPLWAPLASGLLLLNATCLFSFVAVAVGLPIAAFGVLSILMLGAILLVNGAQSRWLLGDRALWGLAALLFGVPILGLGLGAQLDVRSFGLRALYLLMSLFAYLLVVNGGMGALRRLLLACWAVSAVGLIASVIAPDAFLVVALANDGFADYAGRAYGFYMQPNDAATNLILLMVLGLAAFDGRRTATLVLVGLTTIAAVLATGSRSGSAICLVTAAGAAFLWHREGASGVAVGLGKRLMRLVAVLAVAGLALWAVQALFADTVSRGSSALSVGDRVSQVASADTATLDQDESVVLRLAAQLRYIQLIGQKPLSGWGLDAGNRLKEQGAVDLTSHNQLLEAALESGVSGALAAILVVALPLFGARRRALDEALGGPAALVLFGACLMLFMVNSSVLAQRTTYLVIGALLGASRMMSLKARADRPAAG